MAPRAGQVYPAIGAARLQGLTPNKATITILMRKYASESFPN
jgi:hypothetical protein